MITQNIASIRERMQRSALLAGRRPEEVRLVAVSKTVPADRIREAAAAGLRIFGENYIQEARDKAGALCDLPIEWHFIGHLQTNKAKYAVRQFALIHSVDSARLLAEIDREAQKFGKVQDILIQVNIAGEATKSGVEPDELYALLEAAAAHSHVRVVGLMTMPPYSEEPEVVRPVFRSLKTLAERYTGVVPGIDLRELSMGMSGDFEVAISEGATLVRIGTAIFGERS
uniref:Pyridoxal phosphate homeostasis protein n=1 Tax=Desulfatirhabdium butyrativorans TaxID=340467 RepID=A0A7C4MMU0_9BACT